MSAATGRRLILHMSVSLDGFAAKRDHEIDWYTPGEGRLPDHGASAIASTSSCSVRSA